MIGNGQNSEKSGDGVCITRCLIDEIRGKLERKGKWNVHT